MTDINIHNIGQGRCDSLSNIVLRGPMYTYVVCLMICLITPLGGGRMRSHTALRIEKIKQEKTKRSKIKSIKWRENNSYSHPGKCASVIKYIPEHKSSLLL